MQTSVVTYLRQFQKKSFMKQMYRWRPFILVVAMYGTKRCRWISLCLTDGAFKPWHPPSLFRKDSVPVPLFWRQWMFFHAWFRKCRTCVVIIVFWRKGLGGRFFDMMLENSLHDLLRRREVANNHRCPRPRKCNSYSYHNRPVVLHCGEETSTQQQQRQPSSELFDNRAHRHQSSTKGTDTYNNSIPPSPPSLCATCLELAFYFLKKIFNN